MLRHALALARGAAVFVLVTAVAALVVSSSSRGPFWGRLTPSAAVLERDFHPHALKGGPQGGHQRHGVEWGRDNGTHGGGLFGLGGLGDDAEVEVLDRAGASPWATADVRIVVPAEGVNNHSDESMMMGSRGEGGAKLSPESSGSSSACAQAWTLEWSGSSSDSNSSAETEAPPHWKFPWEEDPTAWAEARRVNALVEERHRRRDSIVYFLHVHKGGGTTLCASAILNHERTTKHTRYDNDTGDPLDDFGRMHNCNLFWRVEGQERVRRKGRDADPRLRGSAAEQMDASEALGHVCRAGDPKPPPACGISFVANEFELPPPGEFLTSALRPWVYVAVVRDPLNLGLSNWMMGHRGRSPRSPRELLIALESSVGHLVSLFCGVPWSARGDKDREGNDDEVDDATVVVRLAVAVSRLKHFSVVIDTTSSYDNGYAVLRHRLGWAATEVRPSGTHNAACISEQPAFINHPHVRERALELFANDIRFYFVASAFAAHQFRELSRDVIEISA